ncbi:MAG: tRNA (adenosine(37)-N6)-threonylcarbamoyltransferase complex transferase subunit TsaD, partial [Epsilonproteobacteria bacterium]|nr:tRNA (adenosine(37)-N6)-threonylcarbamoyltransferase complex transferase subunit TsaD [Campylobacterota bacterium]NPA88685.1 tRNA (adenosine(37)-N6)-threonylcarbamoyltransferase complex transferase subunit TsaD [Campylobacterota bacterium]
MGSFNRAENSNGGDKGKSERGGGVILSIESSCDDSAVAVTEIATKKLLFHRKISQESIHSNYGGVVPELASRLHAVYLPQLIEKCRPFFNQIEGIAVTNTPGLAVTLQEGVIVAQALGESLKVPLIPVNHLVGHIYSLFIEKEEEKPLLILLVSGGHTKLLWFEGVEKVCEISTTLDDSLGEAFDKVAKMLGLGYPGGPVIEKLAEKGSIDIGLPIPLKGKETLNFSFSGLKNAVRLAIQSGKYRPEDIAYSFQRSAIAHIVEKLEKAILIHSPPAVGIVGGASANLHLRKELKKLAEIYQFKLLSPPLEWCSDNGAMIGRAGIELF